MKASRRIDYLDNGKALASVLGIVYHCALVFSRPWAVSVPQVGWSQGLDALAHGLSWFRMPLFLFVAGYFSSYGVVKHGPLGFLKHRTWRIGLPLASSLLLLLPFEVAVMSRFAGSDWVHSALMRLNPLSPSFSFMHLWFLYHIVVFSLLVAGVERALAVATGLRARLARLHPGPWVWIVGGTVAQIGLTLAAGLVEDRCGVESAWLPLSALARNLPMFAFGYWCHRDRNLIDELPARPSVLLLSALALGCAGVLSRGIDSWSAGVVADAVLRWGSTTVVLVALKHWLDRSNPVLRYAGDQSYPVYLFHQPVVIALGALLLGIPELKSAWPGYSVLLGASFVLTYLSVEFLVRRSRLGSLLFTGLRRSN